MADDIDCCGSDCFDPAFDRMDEDVKMTTRQWLETAVEPDLAEEIIKPRQRLRKPMTDFAAKLLAKKLSQCPNPSKAHPKR